MQDFGRGPPGGMQQGMRGPPQGPPDNRGPPPGMMHSPKAAAFLFCSPFFFLIYSFIPFEKCTPAEN